MKLIVFNQQYTVKFRHFLDAPQVTVCNIRQGENTLGIGHALCSEKDTFSRARGRKLAFARALQNAFTDRSKRRFFWNAARQDQQARREHCNQDEWGI